MDHSPGFLKVVADAKTRVREIFIDQARAWLKQNPKVVLLDVREDSEWNAGHAAEALHLGKGVLERDLEKMIPDVNTEIIMYCGGGFRSALACDVAQKMGYRSVHSLIGGYKGMKKGGRPVKRGEKIPWRAAPLPPTPSSTKFRRRPGFTCGFSAANILTQPKPHPG